MTGYATEQPKPRPPHTGCPTCGHTTNHDGHAVAQIACDTAAFERARATAWLTTAAGLPDDEAARVIRKLSIGVGVRQGVRVLDILLDLGWRPGGER